MIAWKIYPAMDRQAYCLYIQTVFRIDPRTPFLLEYIQSLDSVTRTWYNIITNDEGTRSRDRVQGLYHGYIRITSAFQYDMTLIAAAIIAVPFVWCGVRILIKRLSLYFRLTSVCRKNGARLIPTHLLWMFGGRNGVTCDFYIEAPDTVYSVKLFPMHRYHTELHFTDDGKYYIRSFVAFAAGILTKLPVDSKRKTLTDYDLLHDFRSEWHMKRFCPVLLINPVCREIRYVTRNDSKILGAGEMVNGMHIYPLSRFLGGLEVKK